MNLEFVGGTKDGEKVDITPEDFDERIFTISYRTDTELYIAKKFKGEFVLFYQGKLKK